MSGSYTQGWSASSWVARPWADSKTLVLVEALQICCNVRNVRRYEYLEEGVGPHNVLTRLHTFYIYYNNIIGGTQWRSWLRHYAKSRRVAGSIPDEVIYLILPAALCPCGQLSL
jgi:hypothetical protein